MNREFRQELLCMLTPMVEYIITQEFMEVRNSLLKMYGANNSCDWIAHYIVERDENIKELSSCKPVVNKWTEDILKLTSPSGSVLGVGSAIGFSSLYLSLNNIMDFNQEMLNLENVMIFCSVPIGDNYFDVVWHAGLVKDFTESEAQFIINENCIIAKIYKEKNNLWRAGIKNIKATQKKYSINIRLKLIREYTIDLKSALSFLPVNCCNASVLKSIYRNLPTEDDCGQENLIVTIGEK